MPKNASLRIVQLIDSLEPGGAERMAVNYANALSKKIAFSGIVVTRKEGTLKKACNQEVSYLYLNKKSNRDTKAFFKLRTYCKRNEITHIHAHSSSFLWAVLIKLITRNTKVIWHNHLGASDQLKGFYFLLLKYSSYFFNISIAVNPFLEKWALENLYTQHTLYLPNFSVLDASTIQITNLRGVENKRILCLANLRPEKNHQLILEIAQLLKKSHPQWTFHFVGKDNNDAYSNELKKQISTLGLQDSVYLYGSKDDISYIIQQTEFSILTSLSEGLPVSLLEVAREGKTVVASNVGDVSKVVVANTTGILIEEHHLLPFYEGILKLIEDVAYRNKLAEAFRIHIANKFDAKKVIKRYLLALEA